MQLRVFKKSFLFILLVGLENLKATDARKIEVMYSLLKRLFVYVLQSVQLFPVPSFPYLSILQCQVRVPSL